MYMFLFLNQYKYIFINVIEMIKNNIYIKYNIMSGLNLGNLETAITNSLNTVVNDTFGTVFSTVGDQFNFLTGNASNFDFSTLDANIVNSFSTFINNIESITQSLLNDINNLLSQPIEDILSVGQFVTFLTTVQYILIDNITTYVGVKITYELTKPLIKSSFEITKSLYSLKGIPIEIINIKYRVKYDEIITRLNLRKTRVYIKHNLETFQNQVDLKLNISKFITLPLIALSLYFIFTIGETRNDITKHSLN